MENENTEMETVEETQTPVQVSVNVESVTLNAEQYEALIGVVEQTRTEVQKSNEQLYSVWFLLALMVLFEVNRVISGASEKLRKVRK